MFTRKRFKSPIHSGNCVGLKIFERGGNLLQSEDYLRTEDGSVPLL